MLGSGAKHATPPTPHPQHRKIKQIATPKNLRGGLRGDMRGWHLKVC